MSMFGPKMGTYCTYSEKDKRFNHSWREKGLCCMGTPQFIKDWAKEKAKELGLKDYPDDLEVSFMKD
jgi:hypothetical protein